MTKIRYISPLFMRLLQCPIGMSDCLIVSSFIQRPRRQKKIAFQCFGLMNPLGKPLYKGKESYRKRMKMSTWGRIFLKIKCGWYCTKSFPSSSLLRSIHFAFHKFLQKIEWLYAEKWRAIIKSRSWPQKNNGNLDETWMKSMSLSTSSMTCVNGP